MGSLSLYGIDLGCAFATDISSTTPVNKHIKREVAAENVFAQVTSLFGNPYFSFEDDRTAFVGRPNENDTFFR